MLLGTKRNIGHPASGLSRYTHFLKCTWIASRNVPSAKHLLTSQPLSMVKIFGIILRGWAMTEQGRPEKNQLMVSA